MIGQPVRQDVAFQTPVRRRDDAEMRTRYTADAGPIPAPPPAAPPTPSGPATPAPADRPTLLTANQVAEQFDQFLVTAGAVARINDAGREHGQIRAFNNRTFDVAKAVPTVVMRNEDYGRISRAARRRHARRARAEHRQPDLSPKARRVYNVVAEIPGTDKAQEVVMLGGHSIRGTRPPARPTTRSARATMLEAIRILQAIGVKPRRTIRVALWSGEEQGLLGSQAYVKEHFGMVENPKPEHAQLRRLLQHRLGHRPRARAYGVRSAGSGGDPARSDEAVCRQRILRRQRHAAAAAAAARITRRSTRRACPASASSRIRSSTDSHTWHTNLDTYERDHRKRCAAVGDGDRGGRVSPGDARRDAAAVHQGAGDCRRSRGAR